MLAFGRVSGYVCMSSALHAARASLVRKRTESMKMRHLAIGVCAAVLVQVHAAVYYVDGVAEGASDANPGTEALPWRTIARAGSAAELASGDTVLVRSGVYREHAKIAVSGKEGAPITFAAAPGARVVIKGSEIVRGTWTKLSDDPAAAEPFPNAYSGVWRVELGDEYFTDADFPHAYEQRERRWVSQVTVNDDCALQLIGPDKLYHNEGYSRLRLVGQDLTDITDDSFYFDPETHMLYIKIRGEPLWYVIEVAVRGWVLTAVDVHDVVIKGFEMRHNRQPGGQWSMVGISNSERVVLEDCRLYLADFCGLSLGRAKNCIVRRCELSRNGCNGLNLHKSEDCLIEDCTLILNNYRRFSSSWAAAGMKNIPGSKRCEVRNCEVAYNIASHGIWFDADNEDIRILSNVSHHNEGCGIFFEINKGGGVIADNLVYANQGRGIYISGSQNTFVVNNTVVANECGIVAMPRGADWPLENVHVYNNLLIRNYITAATVTRGNDLTLYMGCESVEGNPYRRTVLSNHADYNVYAATGWVPFMRHSWNPDNTLAEWQARFGEDKRSRTAAIRFELPGTGFRLLTAEGLDCGGPVPEQAGWQPAVPNQVGCSRTRWP